MNDTLRYVLDRFGVTDTSRFPVEIPDADRRDLAILLGALGFTKGAEVGVERGVYAKMLSRKVKGKLYCIDPWRAYAAYREHVSQAKLDAFHEETVERLRPYDVEIIRKFSVEAAKSFADGELDYVYLDGNHELSHVVADLVAWAPKVRKGGIVAGHDWIKRKNPEYLMHVVQAVTAYCDAYDVKPLFVLGRKEIVDGEKRDKQRSWFFVVE